MKCTIEESIAIHCDEPEQLIAWEKFQYLEKNGFVYINGIHYEYDELAWMLGYDLLGCYTEDNRIKLYIDKIAELLYE